MYLASIHGGVKGNAWPANTVARLWAISNNRAQYEENFIFPLMPLYKRFKAEMMDKSSEDCSDN